MQDNSYFWTCDHCRNRNSRLAVQCFGCSRKNPRSILNITGKASYRSSAVQPVKNVYDRKKLSPIQDNDQFGKHLISEVIGQRRALSPQPYKLDKAPRAFSDGPSVSIDIIGNRSSSSYENDDNENIPPGDLFQFVDENILKKSCPIGHRKSKTCESLAPLKDVIKQERIEYNRLLKTHQQRPFVDPDFPTNRASLYRSNEECDEKYDRLVASWLRIESIDFGSEIRPKSNSKSKKDNLCAHGQTVHITDFRQGKLGDCWLISSLTCLVYRYPNQIKSLIPDSKIHLKECCYQLFFCLDGKWTPIYIDDHFPCDSNDRLVFTEAIKNQFFAPLIEKALAKKYSCYKALIMGHTMEGFSTFTGMPVYRYFVPTNGSAKTKNEFWKQLSSVINEHKYLVAASCHTERFGLHSAHAYSLLDVRGIPATYATDSLAILLSNPWGDQKLVGRFAQDHQLYLKCLNQKHQHGLFWLSYKNFIECFNYIDVCKYDPQWRIKRFEFKLPFNINDQQNFNVFKVDCSKTTDIHLTVYQANDRTMKLPYRLTLSISIYKVWPDDSFQLYTISPMFSEKIHSFEINLAKGKYLVLISGFNHWGITSRFESAPKLVLAIHSNCPVKIDALNPSMELFGDLLIRAVLGAGVEKKSATHNFIEYELKRFSAFVWMVENLDDHHYLVVKWNTKNVVNAFNLRSRNASVDIIAPKCRQIIGILARESDKTSCEYNCSFSTMQLDKKHIDVSKHRKYMDRDIQLMASLFAPRIVLPQLMAEHNRHMKMDVSNQTTNRSFCKIS